ncbi:MAG: type II toxin-antitoxin system Phd/YefM family antitoxin [Vicinamibacterales bacterium]
MKAVAAGQFKDRCFKLLDEVEKSKTPIVVTKRGRPVAKVVPYLPAAERSRSLIGSVRESGDPYGTGEAWDDKVSLRDLRALRG